MDVCTLLLACRLLSDADLARVTPAAVEVITKLPNDPATYDSIANECFQNVLSGVDHNDVTFSRVESIFRALLYYDGRSFLGCLRLVDLSSRNGCGDYGVNSLAALANSFRSHGVLQIPRERLIEMLQGWINDPLLEHNVVECLRFLTQY